MARTVTVRIFLAIAASKNWEIHQIDVNNAYLHCSLEEEIYLQPLLGYQKTKKGQVCRLIKSLYGLKQAGRQWHKELSNQLMLYGFQRYVGDHCLFTLQQGKHLLALLIYIDDILISGDYTEMIKSVKDYLHSLYTIKDMGQAKYFLGIEMTRDSTGIMISQMKYAADIIKDAKLESAGSVNDPFNHGILLYEPGEKLQDPEEG